MRKRKGGWIQITRPDLKSTPFNDCRFVEMGRSRLDKILFRKEWFCLAVPKSLTGGYSNDIIFDGILCILDGDVLVEYTVSRCRLEYVNTFYFYYGIIEQKRIRIEKYV